MTFPLHAPVWLAAGTAGRSGSGGIHRIRSDRKLSDKHRACWVDRFTTTVDELLEDYVKPQENGDHYHCAFVKVGELKAEGTKPISLTLLTTLHRS